MVGLIESAWRSAAEAARRRADQAGEPGRAERGQATVETVIALFLGAILVFAVLCLVMGAYSINATFGGIQAASWEVNASQMQAAGDKNAYVKNVITSRVTGINKNSLTVSNAKITTASSTNDFSVSTKTLLGESKLSRRADTANIKFTVTYTAPYTFGLIKITRNVDHDLTTSVRSEVK